MWRVGVLWRDGDLYFTSGPGTGKARSLAAYPACTGLVVDGVARRVTGASTWEQVAARYRDIGWPAEVVGDAFAGCCAG